MGASRGRPLLISADPLIAQSRSSLPELAVIGYVFTMAS